MQIFDKPDCLIPDHERGVGLGFFDGVHRGHLELLRTLIFHCRKLKLPSAVFTFPFHPETVIRPDDPFDSYLGSLEDRLRLLAESGISETHLQDFDSAFASVEPEIFLNDILAARLKARLIVVGEDYRFGRHGRGDITLLRDWAAAHGIQVIVVSQVRMLGDKVSSSRIRNLISSGDLVQAASLLGRPYSISGTVVAGRGIGSQMGFPTANTPVPSDIACPAFGVYATRIRINGQAYDSITNIGLRPTINPDEKVPVIETYLYDTELNIYGQYVQVDFLKMIRPEMKFSSLLRLGAQIQEDLRTVSEWHRNSEQCFEKAKIKDIPLFLLPTSRFAQSAAHLVFCCPLEKRLASCQALLMRVLTASCRRYPSRTQLATALDSLYGSSIEANIEKHGDLQVIDLTAEGLAKWTDGTSPFRETLRLLFDLLFDPLLDENGLFDDMTVEAERQNLILELTARENDRGKYAYDHCLSTFCGSQVQGLSPAGDRKIIQEITRQDLADVYQELLAKTRITFYLGGRIDPEMIRICTDGLDGFPASERPVFRPANYPSPFIPEKPSSQVEHKSVEQARIVMAFTGLPPYFSHQSIVATVMNSMLGGDVHSLLFDVVREKMGLAYSVFSINQRFLSALFVMAGVAVDKVEAAAEAIRQQVNILASGKFEQSLFDRACQMIEASVLSITDDLSTMLGQQILGQLYGRVLNRHESLDLLHAVDPAEVIAMASRVKLNTCYVLTSTGQEPMIEPDNGVAAREDQA